jgi:hypothetical protein
MYFSNEPRNATDGVWRNLNATQRALVTVDLQDTEEDIQAAIFNITVGRGRDLRLTPEID